MVKILPITFKYIPTIQSAPLQSVQDNKSYSSPIASGMELAFCGNSIPKLYSVDLSPATNMTGIHCPCCGVQTINENTFQKILNEADRVETTKQFVSLLKEYDDYIPTYMREVLTLDDETMKELEDRPVVEYVSLCREKAYAARHDSLHYAKEFMYKHSQTMPDGHGKQFIENISEFFDPTDESPTNFYSIFGKVLTCPDVDSTTKSYLTQKILPSVNDGFLACRCFLINDYKHLPQNELARLLVNNIFENSKSTLTKIQNQERYAQASNNEVIVCNSCSKNAPAKTFMNFNLVQNPAVSKLYMLSYLGDISKAMGEGKLETNKFYFNNFAFYVGKLSRGQIELSNVEIDRIHNLRTMIKRREPFAPIEQTKIDIPCACCSSTMLPHAKRLNIQADLFKANSLSDYANVLKKYDKYVGHYAADYRDIFLNIVNQNPNISMEDFLIEFDKKVEKFAKYEVILALEDFDDSIEYLKSEGTPEQLKLATTIRERMHKYIASGMFADYNYTNLLRNVLGDIDLDCPECSKGVYVLLDDMKKVAYKTTLVRQNNTYENADKDPVFTILFNLFKSDVATADYLVAAKKGGKSTKDNIVGLCKGCNSLKNNKGVAAWYAQNLNVRKNFHKHLDVVDAMAKDKLIEGYDGWAREIADKMYELTHSRYDIRWRYKKD